MTNKYCRVANISNLYGEGVLICTAVLTLARKYTVEGLDSTGHEGRKMG
ncbi:MAG: hypothetical protein J6U15_08895 [Lachnospiraceae bacterium]|nr:hypothetical protein [Lachnospiraceae bacterium]